MGHGLGTFLLPQTGGRGRKTGLDAPLQAFRSYHSRVSKSRRSLSAVNQLLAGLEGFLSPATSVLSGQQTLPSSLQVWGYDMIKQWPCAVICHLVYHNSSGEDVLILYTLLVSTPKVP